MNLFSAAPIPVPALGEAPEAVAARVRSGGNRTLDQVANGFESMFLSLLIKEMRQTLEPGSLFNGDSSDVQGGLFDLFLGQHLAQAGGLGIGTMLRRHLESTQVR